jgi:hypothetical protein
MLISQPGSDYQITQVTLDAGNARDVMLLLIDVRAVLDHLCPGGTRPGASAPAETLLRHIGSPYTLPALIQALDDVAALLGNAERQAFQAIPGTSTGD